MATVKFQPSNDIKQRTRHLEQLSRVPLLAKTPTDMQRFLEDFLSPTEIRQFSKRWDILDMLLRGFTQREIKKQLGVSISKISRGSYVMQSGNGGIQALWKKSRRR